MRLEKPHSLSYQATMRTNVPPRTLVWSMPKVAECGSWLRSDDTIGSLVHVTIFDSRFDFAAAITALLTSSIVVARLATKPRSMKETFGVGTRIAAPSSLPARSGRTRPTGLADPIVVR